jgi:glycine/D-amino acid oxidase-like deaminating enzyme
VKEVFYLESVWKKEINIPKFHKLNKDVACDVLVIGGGIAGILCANALSSAGVDCILVEADRILCGVTSNTTAKITAQHGAIFDKMIVRFGLDNACLYYKAQNEAIKEYKKLCKNIDCDFEEKCSAVYSLRSRKRIEKEARALELVGANAEFKERIPVPLSIAGAVEVKNQAQFNPLKFCAELSRNLKIYEGTRVLEINSKGAVTEASVISAKKIIVATHFPFINKTGLYFIKMYQHRSYVSAYKNADNVGGMYIDEEEGGLSFRNYKDMLLIGGGGHRTGKGGEGWKPIENFKNLHYKSAAEVCRFATQDCKTLDDLPYIGRYSKSAHDLYVATGFNKWGMTNSMVAATILRDLILGKQNDYAKLFSPQRSILRSRLAVNSFESVIGLIKPTTPRCPHLGCALEYNKQEHSWDCPCHGSRFDESGKLLDNPATGDIKNPAE